MSETERKLLFTLKLHRSSLERGLGTSLNTFKAASRDDSQAIVEVRSACLAIVFGAHRRLSVRACLFVAAVRRAHFVQLSLAYRVCFSLFSLSFS